VLRVANSVWGCPKLISQWRTTSNALEGIAAGRNSMLLALDELAEISGKDLQEAVYMLGNGAAKARAGMKGNTEPVNRWKLAIVSSGELSIAAKLAEAGKTHMAGHEMRLIDIEADARRFGAFDNLHDAASAAAFADDLKSQTSKLHGSIGPAFVRWLILKNDGYRHDARNFMDGLAKKILAKTGLTTPDPQSGRVLNGFAQAALAGEVATFAGLTGWTTGEALNAAALAFDAWHEAKSSSRIDVETAYLEPLRRFIAANTNGIVNLGKGGTGGTSGTNGLTVTGTPVGWRDDSFVYLTSESWQTVFPGIGGNEAARALIDAGVMLKGDGNHNARRAPTSVPGRPRLFTVRVDKLLAAV